MEDEVCKEFSLGEENFGMATSIFGVCTRKKKPHIFHVDADFVGADVRKKLHGNAKGGKFDLNYKLTASMQQMVNGVSQMETLCGFLDLLCSSSLWSHIEKAEKVLGKTHKQWSRAAQKL